MEEVNRRPSDKIFTTNRFQFNIITLIPWLFHLKDIIIQHFNPEMEANFNQWHLREEHLWKKILLYLHLQDHIQLNILKLKN